MKTMKNMKKIIDLIVILTVMGSSILSSPFSISASDALSPYREMLAQLNTELGTEYTFPSEGELAENGEDYADLVQYYTAMDREEFREYVVDAYQREVAAENAAENATETVPHIELYAYSGTQRFYYTIYNYNNLYIKCTRYSGDGERYSSIDSYGESHTAYPYFKPASMDKTFNTGKTKVTCAFHCRKYIAKNLRDTKAYIKIAIFSAAGGNVYTA